MTKDQKTTAIIVTASVLFVALVAFILWRMYEKKTNAETDDGDAAFPLQEGGLGKNVKILQEYLNQKMSEMVLQDNLKLTPLKVDGIFGTKTKNACILVLGTDTVTEDQFQSLMK